jgi:transposase
MKVTEYITHEKVCPCCGKAYVTEFPTEVTQPVQYGQKMNA